MLRAKPSIRAACGAAMPRKASIQATCGGTLARPKTAKIGVLLVVFPTIHQQKSGQHQREWILMKDAA